MSFKKFSQSGKLRKVLEMGALVAEAGSKGSAGNIASKIVESKFDLSDFRKRNGIDEKRKNKSPNNGKGPDSLNEEKNPDMPQ